MRKHTLLALSIFLLPSVAYAQDRQTAIQQISKQRDIADYKCKNSLPNPRAAIGFCKKRDALQRKLDNMNKGQNHKQYGRNSQNNHNQRH